MYEPSPRERLERVLRKQPVDRPPVICTGGMMNAAVVDVMRSTGHTLPEAHSDGPLMADLALDVMHQTGFENLGLPFCLTVEAEVLGSEVTYGTLACEPKIVKEAFPSVSSLERRPLARMLSEGRVPTILQAASRLASAQPDLPIIGNLSGPISTAASLVDPIQFFKALRKDPSGSHAVLSYVSELLVAFARLMLDNGASVISIGDPSATGEILGPKAFASYAVPYLNQILDAIHAHGKPAIVHICGNINSVRTLIPEIRADAISTDALVDLKKLKADYPQLTTMGNLSTYLLEFGPAEKVAARARSLVEDGVDIISPACGLSTSTKIENIRAMTAAVKGA